MTQSIQSQLQDRIELFAADITAILQQAVKESVSQTLSVASRSGSRGGARGIAKGAAASPSRKRAGKAIGDADLMREVKREGGRRMEEIAKSLSMPTGAIVPTMKKLIADKKIKTTGQARGTRYTAK